MGAPVTDRVNEIRARNGLPPASDADRAGLASVLQPGPAPAAAAEPPGGDLAAQIAELRALAAADALRRVRPDCLDLADRVSFLDRLGGVSPASPGFDAAVSAAAREVAGPTAAERAAAAAAEAERERALQDRLAAEAKARRLLPSYQWTQSDADDASLEETTAAYHRGQLTELGMPLTPRPERREPARPAAKPTTAQVRKWAQMPPWKAQRERAAWRRAHAIDAAFPQPREAAAPAATRLSNEELLRRGSRRAQLTVDTPADQITAEDLAIAPPALVEQWVASGKLSEQFGVPPQRKYGRR